MKKSTVTIAQVNKRINAELVITPIFVSRVAVAAIVSPKGSKLGTLVHFYSSFFTETTVEGWTRSCSLNQPKQVSQGLTGTSSMMIVVEGHHFRHVCGCCQAPSPDMLRDKTGLQELRNANREVFRRAICSAIKRSGVAQLTVRNPKAFEMNYGLCGIEILTHEVNKYFFRGHVSFSY